MTLSDVHPYMREYLQNDCYCPGEIYDVTGFFFRTFEPDDVCTLLVKGSYKGEDVTAVVCKDQILCFWIEKDKIVSAYRYDATENNTSEICSALTGKKEKIVVIDEFENGKTAANLKEIMSIADAIIVD